ncbi:hypothetical protein ACI3KS_11285 [Microbacterium sp. ZW T5_45]|uniref:hypothetical protein n=1 Tax=Microbacterium sp. ZW T5_45 TaxID=3378080 RepID=UPI0038540C32
MKLRAAARVDLGPGSLAFPKPPTVCLRADGSAVCIATSRTDSGWVTSLVRVRPSGEHVRMPIPEGAFGAQPVIVDRGDGGFVVLVDDRNAVLIDEALSWSRAVEIRGTEDRDRQVAAGGIARQAEDGDWLVVLSDPVTFQNARTIAELHIDGEVLAWESIELLDGKDYPMAGGRTSTAPGGVKAPIIGDVIDVSGSRFVAAQGSDTASMLRYGSDFFTLAELDGSKRIARRVYEESGWKKAAGKHGIRARFTSDGTSAILTPVFRTGGRQRLIGLVDRAIEEISPIRGAATFALVDVRGSDAILASDEALLFATVED